MFLINEYNRNLSMKDQAIKTKKNISTTQIKYAQ